jgi:hypothetical protein
MEILEMPEGPEQKEHAITGTQAAHARSLAQLSIIPTKVTYDAVTTSKWEPRARSLKMKLKL